MGSGKVIITVYLSDGSSFALEQDKKITISYDRSTGAFEPVIVNGAQTVHYVDKITFASGTRTYTITMVKETGKHVLEG